MITDSFRYIVLILTLSLYYLCSPADRNIDCLYSCPDTIGTQAEFDNLLKKTSDRYEVNAYLQSGIYIVNESQPIYAKFQLRGRGATLKQKNRVFTKSDAIRETSTHYICATESISEFSLFVNKDGNIVPVSEEVDPQTKINIVTNDILRNDGDSSQYIEKIKIQIPDRLSHLSNSKFDRAFGYVDSWWTAPSLTVSHSDSTYFYCDLLQKREQKQYNAYINGEKYQYHEDVPFVIYNVRPMSGSVFFDKDFIYIPKEYDMIEVIDSKSKPLFIIQDEAEVKFEGIKLENCTSGFDINKNSKGGSLKLIDCTFNNILKQAIVTYYKTDFKTINITGCYFSNFAFIDGVPLFNISAPKCVGKITECVFNQYEYGFCFYKNVAQNIYISNCKEFEINDNVFFNNSRGGLFLLNGEIDVSSNEFYNDSIFNSYPCRNFSRDAGAIYCSKLYTGDSRIPDDNPNKIQLRLNKIHDFYGKGDVRGIFIDDGRGDVACYGNLILRGQYNSIDSRFVKKDPYSSIRNRLEYNILEYPYCFKYGDSISIKDRPILHDNILLFTDRENKTTTPSTTDIRTMDFEINGNEVMIGHDIWMTLPDDVRQLVRPLQNAGDNIR